MIIMHEVVNSKWHELQIYLIYHQFLPSLNGICDLIFQHEIWLTIFFAKMHKLLFISGNNFEISIYYYVLLKLSFYARNYSAGKLYAFWKKTNNLLQLFIWVRPLKKPAMWQGVILISSLFETRTDILAYSALYEKIDNWFNQTYFLILLMHHVYEWFWRMLIKRTHC